LNNSPRECITPRGLFYRVFVLPHIEKEGPVEFLTWRQDCILTL